MYCKNENLPNGVCDGTDEGFSALCPSGTVCAKGHCEINGFSQIIRICVATHGLDPTNQCAYEV